MGVHILVGSHFRDKNRQKIYIRVFKNTVAAIYMTDYSWGIIVGRVLHAGSTSEDLDSKIGSILSVFYFFFSIY
jgi:ribosomal protein L10